MFSVNNTALKNQQGLTPLLVVATIAIIISIGVIVSQSEVKNIFLNQQEIAETPIATPTTTPLPTITPTPTAAPSAKPTATASATPKPTPTPQATLQGPPGTGFSRVTVGTSRGNFTASIVTLDGGAKMVTDSASDGNCDNDCPTKSLADFVSQNGGFAGINGTYFCPDTYPECAGKKNSFDFPVYNSRLNKWINEDKLFWNDRSVIYQDGTGMHMLRNANSFNGSLTAGIVNYPGLLDGGNIIVSNDGQQAKVGSKGTKGGIGFGSGKIFLVIANNVDVVDFAEVFKAIGATHAINLDGGGSSALFHGGYKVGPGRALPNAIIFK